MKKIFFLTVCFLIGTVGFCTDKLPIKIVPAQNISTVNNELEIGDIVEFKVQRDVYKNDKIFIPAGTKILGTIDYISENGWCYDNAQIEFKKFRIEFPDGTTQNFESALTIDGFEMLKNYKPKTKRFFQYIGSAFRGKEIDITTDYDAVFNVWYSTK